MTFLCTYFSAQQEKAEPETKGPQVQVQPLPEPWCKSFETWRQLALAAQNALEMLTNMCGEPDEDDMETGDVSRWYLLLLLLNCASALCSVF